ncbi:DUF411 domain-containing protein [Marinomonas ostreistagni]|uniref:DUF411 domain-containing protein n=1 Tax=Marinomonas ostreistagni TaxID=359209 RepID=UPI001951A536|nr:DUF411 domain-containing protein [Marinomonas ostreistagni]MBM6550209.1 DUF411 domain-containing protein [Marinomonas ostreistagni]
MKRLLSSLMIASVQVSILLGSSSIVLASSDTSVIAEDELLEIHKSPSCGCCTDWVEHMQGHGFSTQVQHSNALTEIKNSAGIPANARSCHTAISRDGYVFEGHIPAKFVAQFLAQPPANAKGLVVPAMPVGSPGMEYNHQFMAYTIFQLNEDGSLHPYAVIETMAEQYE